MKFTLVFACVFGAILVANTNAQFLGGFGMGGLGIPIAPPGVFGRVFPPLIPRMRVGLPLRNGMAFGAGLLSMIGPFGLFGKRDVESVDNIANRVENFKTVCTLSSITKSLSCKGSNTFECKVEPRGNVTSMKLRLSDLIVNVPETKERVTSVTFVTRKSGEFTYVHPTTQQKEFVTLFSDAKSEQNGFFVKSEKCFDAFVEVYNEVTPKAFRLALFVNPL